MSIQENANQLRSIDFQPVLGMVSQAKQELEERLGQVNQIMGDIPALSDALGPIQAAVQECETLLGMVANAQDNLSSVASRF